MPNFLNQVPQASQTLGVTQPLILQNFKTIDDAFQEDHVPYTAPGEGKHNRVTLPLQGSAPGFMGTDAGIYNGPSSSGGNIFVHIQTNGGVSTRDIPFTESILSLSAPTSGQGGWTRLPSGIIWIMGSANGNGYSKVTLTGPSIAQILMVTVSPYTPMSQGAPFDPNTAVTLVGMGASSMTPLFNNQFAVYVSKRITTGAVGGTGAGFSFNVMAY